MAAPPIPHQLDICWVDLEPARGAETKKRRPCVVVQCDAANVNSRTFIVAPLLPGHKPWLFAVNVSPSAQNGIDKDRYVHLKQLRAVDVLRVGRRQGKLEAHYLPAIERALSDIFGITSCDA